MSSAFDERKGSKASGGDDNQSQSVESEATRNKRLRKMKFEYYVIKPEMIGKVWEAEDPNELIQ